MQFSKPLVLSAILAIALPGAGRAWEYSKQRGVDLYQADSGGAAVSLICDPDSVYGKGSTASAVLVELGGNPDISGPVELRFPDGNGVNAELVHGRVGKMEAGSAAWETLLAGFRAHQSIKVSVDGQAADVQLGTPKPFTCT